MLNDIRDVVVGSVCVRTSLSGDDPLFISRYPPQTGPKLLHIVVDVPCYSIPTILPFDLVEGADEKRIFPSRETVTGLRRQVIDRILAVSLIQADVDQFKSQRFSASVPQSLALAGICVH